MFVLNVIRLQVRTRWFDLQVCWSSFSIVSRNAFAVDGIASELKHYKGILKAFYAFCNN